MQEERFLHTENLSVGYNKKVLLSNLNLQICRGEMICLLGPNGVGKSTLIRTLIGMSPSLSGEVYINETELRHITTRQLAQKISIVLTQKMSPANLTAFDLVAMGRVPHTNWLGKLSAKDISIVEKSMDLVKISQFSNRQIDSLSDGEKQRVMIAKALAQDTPLIILDEPTAHLDVNNRVELLSLLKTLAKETQKAILLSTHELEMAIQVADKFWLIDKDHNLEIGTPEDLAISSVFGNTFQGEHIKFDMHTGTFKMQYKTSTEIALSGNGILVFWAKQALEKEGYKIVNNGETSLEVASFNDTGIYWKIKTESKEIKVTSIEELIKELRAIKKKDGV